MFHDVEPAYLDGSSVIHARPSTISSQLMNFFCVIEYLFNFINAYAKRYYANRSSLSLRFLYALAINPNRNSRMYTI